MSDEEEKKPTRWHGLTDDQWLSLFDSKDFRPLVGRTLVEIAICKKAEPSDRLASLQILNRAIQLGIVVDDEHAYPELVRDTLLSVTSGQKRGSRRMRRRMSDRLLAVDCLINTTAQFLKKRSREISPEEFSALLS